VKLKVDLPVYCKGPRPPLVHLCSGTKVQVTKAQERWTRIRNGLFKRFDRGRLLSGLRMRFSTRFAEVGDPCYIAVLSNEVLDRVFDFIPMDLVIRYNESDYPLLMPQPLALMHVSRRFRTVLLHSQRWLEFDFGFFHNLGGRRRHQDSRGEYYRRYVALFNLLLDDPYLVKRLEAKTDWVLPCEHYLNLNLLPIIATRISNFRKTARKLGVCFDPELLLTCVWSGVVELVIEIPSPFIADLTTLANAFPNVQYLRLRAQRPWTGSLDSFPHLVHLVIPEFPTYHDLWSIPDSLLPVRSAKSITYLSLGPDNTTQYHSSKFNLTYLSLGLDNTTQYHSSKFNLKPFVNLRHLKLYGVHYPCLSHISSELISLNIDQRNGIPSDPSACSISFTHPCLSNLRSLTLRQADPIDYRGTSDMLESLTEHLRGLHHLTLLCFIFVPHRVDCLARLVQLQSFTFGYWSWVRYQDYKDPEVVFSNVFSELNPKPRIRVFYQENPTHFSDLKYGTPFTPKPRLPDLDWNTEQKPFPSYYKS